MDITYLLLLQSIREACNGVFDSFMLNVKNLGTPLLTFLLLSGVYWCLSKRAGQLMAFNVSVACTLNQAFKNIFKIDRPWVQDSRIEPVSGALDDAGGYSFPSGHTTRATAIWGPLGSYLWSIGERVIGTLCWVIVVMVAFSRNYLGVHTLKDVLVALVAGVFFVYIFEKMILWTDKGGNRDVIVALIGLLLCFIPMLKVGCLSNAGAGMGMIIGWIVEKRFVRFENDGKWSVRCVRFAVGGMGVVFIINVVGEFFKLFMASKYAGFFSMFILGIFIMAVYPYFFSKVERYRLGIILAVIAVISMTAISYGWYKVNKSTDSQADNVETEVVTDVETENVPLVIAHRGYSSLFPENTMASFEGAIDIGADFIELDVQLTKDGQVVVFHDDSLLRITGVEGTISDFTYEELALLDAGGWFSQDYVGERIPTLREVLELVSESECWVYLELKNIGEVDGFEEAVLSIVNDAGIADRCIFASFNYAYLEHFKEIDASLLTLYNTSSGKTTLPNEYPADYYGLYVETVNYQVVEAIHNAGSKAFVWTVDTPSQIGNVQAMGVDGIVTNYPGVALVLRNREYSYLAVNYESSIALPGLYGKDLPEFCDDMVVQGLTKAGNYIVVSAYSKSGEYNSILYIMNLSGNLVRIVDLEFKAHTGGIAYDELHDLLWVTGASGQVYAVSWSMVLSGTYQGEILISFDAGLLNHDQAKVASFLTYYDNELFVGSYVNGNNGVLNRYDLTDVYNPVLISAVQIPERIQGVTFKDDTLTGERYMYLSQGYNTEDACLMKFIYSYDFMVYNEPIENHVLPEGAEQILSTADGMYILFESAVRPYRATARIANDQIYLVRE